MTTKSIAEKCKKDTARKNIGKANISQVDIFICLSHWTYYV